jgi:hypothetical protein
MFDQHSATKPHKRVCGTVPALSSTNDLKIMNEQK